MCPLALGFKGLRAETGNRNPTISQRLRNSHILIICDLDLKNNLLSLILLPIKMHHHTKFGSSWISRTHGDGNTERPPPRLACFTRGIMKTTCWYSCCQICVVWPYDQLSPRGRRSWVAGGRGNIWLHCTIRWFYVRCAAAPVNLMSHYFRKGGGKGVGAHSKWT